MLPEPSPDEADKTAILLINLGTPDAPTAAAVRRYLREFLSDPRVVEIPRAVWWPILNGIVLSVRPKKSAEKYAAIWTSEGSPLKVHTEKQAKLLRGLLGQSGRTERVDYAMRYGDPSIADTLGRLSAEGFRRILLLPLYPQYSASATATVFDAAFGWAKTVRNQPELRLLRSFPDDAGYIESLAACVREHWTKHGRPDSSYRLVMSFHGIPQQSVDLGDPYRDECLTTARLLAHALNLDADNHTVCFQSRFGPAKWLQPYTSATLEELGRQGVQRVDVLCPGFPSDCLETLEEIAIEGKSTFLTAGGKEFLYIPCLNERDDWIRALERLALRHLEGWSPR